MKNLFSIVIIIFLSLFVSCSNNEKSVIESSNLNSMDSIKAIIEDSILNEKPIKITKIHPTQPKNIKTSATIMKFQGASIGKGPGGP